MSTVPLSSLYGAFAYAQTSMTITFITSKAWIWAYPMMMLLPLHAVLLWLHGFLPFAYSTEAVLVNLLWTILLISLAVMFVFVLNFFGYGFGHMIAVPTNGDQNRSSVLTMINIVMYFLEFVWIVWYYYVKRWSVLLGVAIAMVIRLLILSIHYISTRIHVSTLMAEDKTGMSVVEKTPFLADGDDKHTSPYSRLNVVFLWHFIGLFVTWAPMFFQDWFATQYGELICMAIGIALLGIVNTAWAVRLRFYPVVHQTILNYNNKI